MDKLLPILICLIQTAQAQPTIDQHNPVFVEVSDTIICETIGMWELLAVPDTPYNHIATIWATADTCYTQTRHRLYYLQGLPPKKAYIK